MVLTKDQVVKLASALAHRSEGGDVEWRKRDLRSYYVPLSDHFSFVVSRDAENHTVAKILADQDEIVGELEEGEDSRDHLHLLFKRAEEYVSNDIYRTLLNAVEQAPVVGGSKLAPPIFPGNPTEEQAQLFFKSIAGNWSLDYSSGKELVRIDKEGNYFINEEKTPRFKLRLIAISPDRLTVEMGKIIPNGKMLHIEVLTVSDSQMIGVAKHDQHALKYVRMRVER